MKNRMESLVFNQPEEVLVIFGEARLVRVKGRVYLRGGSMAERMEALEWLSIFEPQTVACVGQ
jgi:hypothetical protein